MQPVPECVSCGTCCFSRLEEYVRVSGDDFARFGERTDELAQFDGHRAYMRMVDGHCGALRIHTRMGEFWCDSYASRPQICRDLVRGSGECRAELAAKHSRSELALEHAEACHVVTPDVS